MPRAFVFGILQNLDVLYQIWSNYAPVVKFGPALGVTTLQLHRDDPWVNQIQRN